MNNFGLIRRSKEWAARCESWLSQFSEDERPTAELLLDSITYITHEDVCSGLSLELEKLVSDLNGTCALYPVTNTKHLTRFDGYDQMPFGENGDLGSEGDLGHLCRDVSKDKSLAPTFPFPGISTLRTNRVRHIILINDITSSGDQGEDYLDWMWSSRTIRSWHSGKLVQFHYLSYLLSAEGQKVVANHASRPSVTGLQATAYGHPAWTSDQRNSVEMICRKYGAKSLALGYGDMMSLQVFSYSCPNNVPSILRYGCTMKKFRGLFERRPTKVSGHAISGTTENVAAVAGRLGVRAASLQNLICYALRSGPATPEILSARLGVPLVSVNQGLNMAVNAGFARLLKSAYRLTPNGVRVVRGLTKPAAKWKGRATEEVGGRFDYLPMPRGLAVSSSNASEASEAH